MSRRVFLFDLDGTITVGESLAAVADAFGIGEVGRMTREAVEGTGDYCLNLRRRVEMLGALQQDSVAEVIGRMELRQELVDWIRRHSDCCAVATSNLDCWTARLRERIPCEWFTSVSVAEVGSVALGCQIDKLAVVDDFRSRGYEVVFIGDGANDCAALSGADYAIGIGFDGDPVEAVAEVSDYIATSQRELIAVLDRLV